MKEHNVQNITRTIILEMLSDEEVAKVSTAEEPSHLVEGDEYIDLDRLDEGVKQAHANAHINTSNVLARSAVKQATWTKIVKKLPIK